MDFAIVFLGAGIGGACRHGANLLAARFAMTGFPFGTLTVNILGSLLMGLLAGYLALLGTAAQPWRLFLATGFLGGFTTFSSFSLDAVVLYERGEAAMAALYILVSVAVAILGLVAGLAAGLAAMRQMA